MAKRTLHRLSHYSLLTCDMGNLVPVGLVEGLPGDTFQHSVSAVIRFSPMAAPVMHPITVRMHSFFVPHRFTFDPNDHKAWERFITGGADGNDTSTVPTLQVDPANRKVGDRLDHLGIPPDYTGSFNAMPLRAYNLIFNEYYQDADVGVAQPLDHYDSTPNIAWEKDYFTTARPWPQKGPEVTLPVAGTAPVITTGDGVPTFDVDSQTNQALTGDGDGSRNARWQNTTAGSGTAKWNQTKLVTDMSQATAITVNDLRRATALQRFAEMRARYGSRYTEYLRSIGVVPADARLDRPEFLGGGAVRASISEVVQTANEPTVTRFGVGDLYGHGVAAVRSNRYRYYCQEHGYILTLMSVRPRAMYMQGIDRTWLRNDRTDFWQKELEFIGQQEAYNGEVYHQSANPKGTFGYTDRYREYREARSRVSSEYRTTLKYWHLGREFESEPVLNNSFISCVPSKRIFNVQNQHTLWVAVNHRMRARRLVSKSAYGKII